MNRTRFLLRRSFLLAIFCFFATTEIQAGDEVVLLLNARNPTASVSRGDVSNLFTGKTAFWHGVVPVKVLVRPGTSSAGKAFYEPILGMNAQSFAQHWSKLQLSGKGIAPTTVGSAEEMAGMIAKTPGGVGFVLASEAWKIDGVKVIQIR